MIITKKMEIEQFTDKNRKEWDEFCLKSDDAWFWHTINFMDFSMEYYQNANPVNRSFLIRNGKEILAIFPLIKEEREEGNILSYASVHFTPNPCFRNSDSEDFKKKLLIMGMKEIDRIAQEEKCKECRIELTPLSKEHLHKLRYNYLMDFDFFETSTVTQIIKIDQNIEKVKQNIRKTYRHIFNNYKDKVNFNIYDYKNIDEETFLKYKNMHHKDAGRITRTQSTFRLNFEYIKEGKSFLSEVTLKNGEPLGYSLFYLYKNCALYGSACSEPSSNLPISHLAQWGALQYLNKIGVEYYDTSNQFPSVQLLQDFDDKKKQISFFKRGFGGELHQVFRGRKFYDKEYFKKEVLKQL